MSVVLRYAYFLRIPILTFGVLSGVVFNTTISENGGLNFVSTLDLERVARPEKVATLDSLCIPAGKDGKLRLDISSTTAADSPLRTCGCPPCR